ncbi:MAG: CHRD domain-containing protein [Rubrivivax sp.]
MKSPLAPTLGMTLTLALSSLAWTGPAQAYTVTLHGSLDSAQVVDIDGDRASTSTATGEISITMDTVLQTITADLVWRGLSGPADRSHIHDAPAGVNRLVPPNDRFFHEIIWDDPVSVVGGFVECHPGAIDSNGDPLPPDISCAPPTGELHNTLDLSDGSYFDPTGEFGFTDFNALLQALLSNGIFVDMHTDLYPGGEIRGQLINQDVPEPAPLSLLGLGLLAATVRRRRGG